MTANNDSAELEALFDSVAATVRVEPAPAAPAPTAPASSGITDLGDSDDLQALFDSVASSFHASGPGAAKTPSAAAVESRAGGEEWPAQETVFNRIGQMARQLHDTLHQLGYDKLLEQTVSSLPDAKDRLAYVANLTEQAACRVLNATDIAKPVVDELEKMPSPSGRAGTRFSVIR